MFLPTFFSRASSNLTTLPFMWVRTFSTLPRPLWPGSLLGVSIPRPTQADLFSGARPQTPTPHIARRPRSRRTQPRKFLFNSLPRNIAHGKWNADKPRGDISHLMAMFLTRQEELAHADFVLLPVCGILVQTDTGQIIQS